MTLSPRCAQRGALLGRLQIELQRADADDGRDLVGQRHVFARGHRPRGDVAIEGRADGGVGEGLLRLRELRLHAVERSLRGGDHFEALAGAIGGGFILLARGVGLRFGGFLLGVRFFVSALRDIAGGDQVGVALRIGGGHFCLRLGRLVIGLRGGDFGNLGGIECAAVQPIRDCACRTRRRWLRQAGRVA